MFSACAFLSAPSCQFDAIFGEAGMGYVPRASTAPRRWHEWLEPPA
jgi:hypothetical protein